MKVLKSIKIGFLVLTLLIGGYSAYAVYMVWGDKLLHYNVEMGRLLSTTYKWAIALFCVLLLVDLVLAMASRKKR